MRNEEKRPRLLGMAIAVACCGAFIVGVWGPLADGLDRHFPSRAVVGKHSSPGNWKIELEGASDDNPAVREALLGVPTAFAESIARFGGRIVFTHSDRLAGIRNLDQHDLARAAGVYHPASRAAYISTDGEAAGHTGLHEVGHMLDHALGDLSTRAPFLALYEHITAYGLLSPYARKNPRECFADIFERYYFSDRRRARLAAELPEAIDYMEALERSTRE